MYIVLRCGFNRNCASPSPNKITNHVMTTTIYNILLARALITQITVCVRGYGDWAITTSQPRERRHFVSGWLVM